MGGNWLLSSCIFCGRVLLSHPKRGHSTFISHVMARNESHGVHSRPHRQGGPVLRRNMSRRGPSKRRLEKWMVDWVPSQSAGYTTTCIALKYLMFQLGVSCESEEYHISIPMPAVNIPIPTKIGSKMGGAPTPEWDPIGLDNHMAAASFL